MVKTLARFLLVAALSLVAALGCGSMNHPVASASKVKVNIFHPAGVVHVGNIDQLEKSLGFKFHGATWYQNWDNPISMSIAKQFHDHGLIPTCVWEAKQNGRAVTCQEIIEGKHDQFVTQTATTLRETKIPIRLELFAEMNGEWSPWYAGSVGNSPEQLKSAWIRVVNLFREAKAFNVEFVWVVNIRYGGDKFDYIQLYPGDKWVHLVGVDGYNWGTGDPHLWTAFREVFGRSYTELITLTKRPIIITETACAEHPSGNKAEWIRQMFQDLPTLFPRIKEITWFNEKKERNWNIDSSPGAFEAFQLRGRERL